MAKPKNNEELDHLDSHQEFNAFSTDDAFDYPQVEKIKEAVLQKLQWLKGQINKKNLKEAWKFCKKNCMLNKLKKRLPLKFMHKISDSWKTLITAVLLFLFFYYSIGSMFAEKIDLKTGYKVSVHNTPTFETTTGMAFLLKREVDKKMWTPNLPLIFPAYVLDNMPNFQIGIVSAVRDFVASLRHLEQNTEAQQKNIDKAYSLLNYPPDVWILSKQSTFKLAPSSNSQYRKAGKELRQYSRNGVYTANAPDLSYLLGKISNSLQKLTAKSEEYQREKSSNWLDFSSDNLFYYNRGYAFALWQMGKVLGADYKSVILEQDLYQEWSYMVSSLRKAAEFSPLIVRNGKANSLTAPNHLLMQGYYLMRASASAEKICASLNQRNDNVSED